MEVTNPDPLSDEGQLSQVNPDVHLSLCPVFNSKQIMYALERLGQEKYVTILPEICY